MNRRNGLFAEAHFVKYIQFGCRKFYIRLRDFVRRGNDKQRIYGRMNYIGALLRGNSLDALSTEFVISKERLVWTKFFGRVL